MSVARKVVKLQSGYLAGPEVALGFTNFLLGTFEFTEAKIKG